MEQYCSSTVPANLVVWGGDREASLVVIRIRDGARESQQGIHNINADTKDR